MPPRPPPLEPLQGSNFRSTPQLETLRNGEYIESVKSSRKWSVSPPPSPYQRALEMWYEDTNNTLLTFTSAARELTLDAANAARSSRGNVNAKSLPPAQIKKLLDSRHEREVLEGLRKVIFVGLPQLYTTGTD